MNSDLVVSDDVLARWSRKLQNTYLRPAIGNSSPLSLEGTSVQAMATAVLELLRHIHSHPKDTVPETPPPLGQGMQFIRNVPLRAFLYNNRSYTLRDSNTSGFVGTTTIGRGLERSVWEQMFSKIEHDHDHWQTIGPYSTPQFSPLRDSADDDALWLGYGAACALHLIYSGTAPEPVTPFLLLAVILGQGNFHNLTYESVASFDPGLGQRIRPWFELPDDGPFPTGLTHPVAQLLMQFCEIEVCHISYVYHDLPDYLYHR